MEIKNGKKEIYFKVKNMIMQLSKKCSNFNIQGEPLTIPSKYVIPEYIVEKYHLIPEKIYIYKIRKTREAELKNNSPLPESKIIITTKEIPNWKLENQGIHTNINDDSVDYISMSKEANGKKTIEINVRKPRNKQREKYVIIKEGRKPAYDDNTYKVNYDKFGDNKTTRNDDNTYLQRLLNETIPSRGVEELCATIREQLDCIKGITQETSTPPSDLTQFLLKVAGKLEQYINPGQIH